MTQSITPPFDQPYFTGCPQWSHPQWLGKITPSGVPNHRALHYYSQSFNAVEGNTTFYGMPNREVFTKWRDETPSNFTFFLKFPKRITHELALNSRAIDEAREFLDRALILGSRLGPLFIQLPASFTPHHLNQLHSFVKGLASPRPLAIEVRASEFFTQQGSKKLHQYLSRLKIERVWMDTSPLRAAIPPYSQAVQTAMERKPRHIAYPIALGPHPVIRYVGHPQLKANQPWLKAWATVFARWITEGRQPFFFAHYPGEEFAPELAQYFHTLLVNQLPHLPPLPIWPSERQQSLLTL